VAQVVAGGGPEFKSQYHAHTLKKKKEDVSERKVLNSLPGSRIQGFCLEGSEAISLITGSCDMVLVPCNFGGKLLIKRSGILKSRGTVRSRGVTAGDAGERSVQCSLPCLVQCLD
jgi:hypothetical protein